MGCHHSFWAWLCLQPSIFGCILTRGLILIIYLEACISGLPDGFVDLLLDLMMAMTSSTELTSADGQGQAFSSFPSFFFP